MIEYDNKWILRTNDLALISDDVTKDMIIYALCTSGSCTFEYNGKQKEARKGTVIVLRNRELMKNFKSSNDFAVEGFFLSQRFLLMSGRRSSYVVRYCLLLNVDPIMQLLPAEQERWHHDYENIIYLLSIEGNHFRSEIMQSALWQLFLDNFDFSIRIYGSREITFQSSALTFAFFKLLDEGNYRRHRNIPYFAEKLFVSPKHLSETVKKVSGYSAIYWITHYTLTDLQRELRNSNLSISEIADRYAFSSMAYFTRYLQTHLGVTPSKLRE